MRDLGPIAYVEHAGRAAGGEVFGPAEALALVLRRRLGFVAFNLVLAVAGNEAIGRTHFGILLVLLHPVIGTDLLTAEGVALIVAPGMPADVLVHLDRAQGATTLEAVDRLVGVESALEVVRPRQHVLRPRHRQAAIALHGDRLQILRAEHRTAAAACVDAQGIGHHARHADLILAGLADGERAGLGRPGAMGLLQDGVGLGGVLAPQMARIEQRHFIVHDVQIHGLRRATGDGDVLVGGEAHHVGKFTAARRVTKDAVTGTLESNAALHAAAGTGAGQGTDAEHENIVRPARIAMNIVGQEMLPHNPVIDAGAADPAFEQGVRDNFALEFAAGQIHA